MIYLTLFLVFLKIGAVSFGGGYAMLPLLKAEVVDKRKYLSEEELLDLYSIGQCTPGIIAVNTTPAEAATNDSDPSGSGVGE